MSLSDVSEDKCDCGGQLELVLTHHTEVFIGSDASQVVDSQPAGEIWRCEECGAEYSFGIPVEDDIEEDD